MSHASLKQARGIPELVFKQVDASTVLFRQGNLDLIDSSQETRLDHSLFTVTQHGSTDNYLIIITARVRYVNCYDNGLILRSRQVIHPRDTGTVSVFCTYPEFNIVMNDRGTAAMFARNVTSMPRT